MGGYLELAETEDLATLANMVRNCNGAKIVSNMVEHILEVLYGLCIGIIPFYRR